MVTHRSTPTADLSDTPPTPCSNCLPDPGTSSGRCYPGLTGYRGKAGRGREKQALDGVVSVEVKPEIYLESQYTTLVAV